MIPKIDFNNSITTAVFNYLRVLRGRFSGDIQTDAGQRIVMSTDNSVYQVLPQAILFPRHAEDMQLIFIIAEETRLPEIGFGLRGGGTGTNGQSLNPGILIDSTRYMNTIKKLSIAEQTVTVEPGVILDQLNWYLKPYGYFFPVLISTASRATLGGMASTNACGKGSTYYGRMSDNVIAIEAVLSDGTLFHSKRFSVATLNQEKAENTRLAEIITEVDNSVSDNLPEIQNLYSKLSRTLTGYTLAEVYDDERKNFNLNAILLGSEGTLAAFTELKLKIRRIPDYKQLAIIQYADFNAALEDGARCIELRPAAIETVDEKILALAKTDILFPMVEPFITHSQSTVGAINLVEFVAEQKESLAQQALNFEKLMKRNSSNARLNYHIITDTLQMAALWELRKKSVGLLGRLNDDNRRPLSGVEDTLVPPEKLAHYIVEFRQLLDEKNLNYAMFGHIDAGCLHVRPALDLADPKDEAIYFALIEEVKNLVCRYDGIMWGEHGKGFRSQFVPEVFGAHLFAELCKIKKVFDPNNRLNPGKIAVPSGSAEELTAINAPSTRGSFDREINPLLKQPFYSALQCNGNGACFTEDQAEIICPSFKVTQDRVHSPKGRASLAREWLRLLSRTQEEPTLKFGAWFLRYWLKLFNGKDYSHQVYRALEGCLGCRACATQCPVQVNVPNFKAEFLARYHSRYPRRMRDRLVARSEKIAYFQSKLPRFSNFIFTNRISQFIAKRLLGLAALPKVSVPSAAQQLVQHKIVSVKNPPFIPFDRKKTVVLIQDSVTRFYEADLVIKCYQLLQKLGFDVQLLEWFENGKSWHVKGYIEQFKKIALENCQRLDYFVQHNIPLLGIDPSITLTYRQEYPHYFPEANKINILLFQEFLAEQPFRHREIFKSRKDIVLFMHCTEKTTSTLLSNAWIRVFAKFGLRVILQNTGCCGMAGIYGHEVEHVAHSRQLFYMSWINHLKSDVILLATGYSCRSQIRKLTQQHVMHPVEFLLNMNKI